MIVAGAGTLPPPLPDYHELRDKMTTYGEQTRFADLRELYGSPSAYEVPLSNWKDSILRLTCELDVPDIPASGSGDSSTSGGDRPSSSAESRQSTTIDFPITASPLHVQPGAIGRGTTVLPLACPSDISSLQARDGLSLVAKMSWQPVNRMGEDEILRTIRGKIPEPWMKHVTELKCSTTLDEDALNLPRKVLMAFVETRVKAVAVLGKPTPKPKRGAKQKTRVDEDSDILELADAFIGPEYEERVLRVIVTPRYLPLCEVKDLGEFKTVFTDVVKVHYVIYTSCNILHRDLSVNNIMFTRHDEHVVGILNDWDLAASTIPKETATCKHRTGTAAFMALDLLENAGKPLLHEYHHDLESFVWILLWCAFVLRFDGNQVEWAKQPGKIRQWTATHDWETIASCKLGFVTRCGDYLELMTPEMKGLKKPWIQPVIRKTAYTIVARSMSHFSEEEEEEEKEEESSPNGSAHARVEMTERNGPGFFTFQRVMKVLEPSTKTPEDAVRKYGSPDLIVP